MKIRFVWSIRARAELRELDQETAMRILLALTHMAQAGEGDVKALRGPYAGTYRLRVGKWRVRFRITPDYIHVLAVENRGEAY